MEKSNKRGKIPQSDWPLIMARYDAGETLASIARTYDCSPPAISYVVSRSRTRPPEAGIAAKASNPPEPQLIKAAPADGAATAAPRPAATQPAAPTSEPAPTTPLSAAENPRAAIGGGNGSHDGESPRDGNGIGRNAGNGGQPSAPRTMPPWQRPAPPINGEQRRTLHLSLGAAHTNGGARPVEQPPAERPGGANRDPFAADIVDRRANGGNGSPVTVESEPVRRPDPVPHSNSDGANRQPPSSAFIDRELRARVAGDIEAFLSAFDAALEHDTLDSRAALREATDRLLRAGARTRIELERLEARLPLAARDAVRGNPSWRDR
jgi:hypothetical protein